MQKRKQEKVGATKVNAQLGEQQTATAELENQLKQKDKKAGRGVEEDGASRKAQHICCSPAVDVSAHVNANVFKTANSFTICCCYISQV